MQNQKPMNNYSQKRENKLHKMLLGALMMCLTIVLTMTIKMPIPATQGYIHIGDSMIFASIYLLGTKYGTAVGAVGSAMSDLFSGYSMYIPITFVAKAAMVLVASSIITAFHKRKITKKTYVIDAMAMLCGGLCMIATYCICETFIYGNFAIALASAGMNAIQLVVSMIIAYVIVFALQKTSCKKYFEINL